MLILISAVMFIPVLFDFLHTGMVPHFPTLIAVSYTHLDVYNRQESGNGTDEHVSAGV